MKKEQIKRSIETKRLQLTLGEMESHYGIVVAFIIPLLILIFLLGKGLVTGEWSIHPDFYYVVAISSLLAIGACTIQYKRLDFVSISGIFTKDQILEVVEEIVEKSKWHLHDVTDDAIIFKSRPGFWSGSWGEQITIIIDKDRILINSICDPARPSSVFSNGRNSMNVELLKGKLHQLATNPVYAP